MFSELFLFSYCTLTGSKFSWSVSAWILTPTKFPQVDEQLWFHIHITDAPKD